MMNTFRPAQVSESALHVQPGQHDGQHHVNGEWQQRKQQVCQRLYGNADDDAQRHEHGAVAADPFNGAAHGAVRLHL
jgi:hypothetical protein